ncbi:DUF6766 family protein [Flavobacterium cerinum]|uniref:DUF6766 family protein n=1 Tax=Flavobacterium cerinum TaxID=2502784 RepID=UPI001F4F3B12|nr:DUF6766 family protein [Flavobacterium cerinum]
MKNFLRNNALSFSFLMLFIICIIGQVIFGIKEYNKEITDEGGAAVSLIQYLSSGHFLQSTFENWESEFLQMAFFVILTIFLMQKGSSESKDLDTKEEVDREPDPNRKDVPWPVKRSGWILGLYKHSLTIVLLLLFLLSFAAHFYGSLKDENTQLALKGKLLESASDYVADSRFWFESFQNWQSEFLSVFAIIVLSIYLRQKRLTTIKARGRPTL